MPVDDTNAARAWISFLVAWICYPIYFIPLAFRFLLRVLYRPLAFLGLPAVHLARLILASVAFLFVVAAKLEVSMTARPARLS